MNFEQEFEACKKIIDKEKRVACLLPLLHEVTELQDRVNITTFRTIDNDSDPRWLPLHMIDNANAIILNISRNKADPRIFDNLYVDEKLQGLHDKWFSIKRWLEKTQKERRFKVIGRHRWVPGATITETIDEATNTRRFTATIRGYQNWKLYEGQLYPEIAEDLIKKVEEIENRIDSGDKEIFNEKTLIKPKVV